MKVQLQPFMQLLIVFNINAQNTQWKSYIESDNISAIADDGNSLWMDCLYGGGLIQLEKSSGKAIFYNRFNSDMNASGDLNCIAIDENGMKWIGSKEDGLIKFDGINFTFYNTSNSGIPDDHITSVAFGTDGLIWIGTYLDGLAAYDGSNWVVYNSSNSDLPDDEIYSLYVDNDGIIWIGSGYNLAAFNGTDWTIYNSLIPGPDCYRFYVAFIHLKKSKNP